MKKLLVAIAVMLALVAVAGSRKNDIARNLSVFNQLYKELNTFYVDTINADEAMNTAIVAMLDEIDPYTEYIPEKYQEEYKRATTGEYAGIGSFIMARKGDVYISGPREGSPAALAGLRHGDRIVTVNGDTVLGMSVEEVSRRLKGQPGTAVKVTVYRPWVGADSVLSFDIVRTKIQEKSVPWWGVVRDDIGYICLSSFTDKSPAEVREALLALKADPSVRGIVLDLRGNGGGLVESAVKILGYFLPKGTEVLKMRGRDALNERIYKTSGQPIAPDMPLAVLIDGASASASEIVAGAVQDLDRGVVIGNRSFGKGLVQTTRELPYNNMLKVTMAKYYIPSGRLIQAIDYSRRNPDGTVARIPDSLTSVFRTARGREVRDGGGITPDVTVEAPKMSRIVYNILRDSWAFDFANRVRALHDTIAPAADFTVTDDIYDDFKESIDPARFQYDRVCETMFKQLREAAEVEGYMNDSTRAAFAALDTLLRHDLMRDLDTHRKTIEPILAGEIVERYYHDTGRIVNRLRQDDDLDRAAAIINDPAEYSRLLRPAK